jgi:glutamate dehydrogenase
MAFGGAFALGSKLHIPPLDGRAAMRDTKSLAIAAEEAAMPLDTRATETMTLEGLQTELRRALSDDPAADTLAGKVFPDYRPGELPDISAADFAAAIAGFWGFARGGEKAMRLRITPAKGADGRDLGADLLEIAQPDAPFLVDSVMGEVADTGLAVKAMFHPICVLGGCDVSMIQVWLEPLGEARAQHLIDAVEAAMADVRAAVDDFEPMLALARRTIGELAEAAPGDPDALAEELKFLHWMVEGHFVFLGARIYDYPRTKDGGYAPEEPLYQPEDSLGVLRDPLRVVLRQGSEPAVLSAAQRKGLERAEPVIVAKANLRSRVHRRAYMDYVGVHRYGADRKPSGEIRFVGLFTALAYDEPASEVPLIRRKVARVMARAGYDPAGHNGVRLMNILEGWPRDELFQASEGELLELALGVLHLSDRPKVKLFIRRDPFDRFVSALFYAPRERYDAALVQTAGAKLALAFGGRVSASYPTYGDTPLARTHYIIGVTPGRHLEPDLQALEAELAEAALTWPDRFSAAVRRRYGDSAEALEILSGYGEAFPAIYRDRYGAEEALTDIDFIRRLTGDGEAAVRLFHEPHDPPARLSVTLYRVGETAASLAEIAPILDHMGLRPVSEAGYPVTPYGRTVWLHELVVDVADGEAPDLALVAAPFEEAFLAIWEGRAESDGFNRLVLELGVGWREAALVRAIARYRQQSGLDPSQSVQEDAVSDHPIVTRLILELFRAKFEPGAASIASRQAAAVETAAAIDEALQEVESLDHDRVLRRMAAVVAAMTRTNMFQTGENGRPKSYISFKVASEAIADLPAPKPFREIYVSAPRVEGIHLRFGPVARGGLRWSDRRDDFRTEVLGLVKAQQVKNAVIVPVGSKGGFYPKCLPKGGSPDAIRAEAVEAYKTFLCGLLDVTDNIDADNRVTRPKDVIAFDGDDPYLVVAADKGTATFSDIANGVAQSYGFWLDDAFASGGSAGYDHKAMGITARGAWEQVKRHFRELGKDIQTEPFSVIGVGDMSGDVFGNGMLLSKEIRLIAAFDHRHVFIDPTPDAARSWTERKRMFALPRSSWDDYDKSLISQGGGVFPRTLKSVPISEEMKAVLDIKAAELTPAELINAVLKARAELLYLGGIGNYVKGSSESHLDVGDKANDTVRINGRELKVKVVAEGANLGVTQAGRVEFALAGGRIDTDAIDNSAGVDTSDHEVNIKILTGMAIRAGDLKADRRDALLASMTDEIADHVLRHNYDQGLALTLLESESAQEAASHEGFISGLEARGKLDRTLEGLPSNLVLEQRLKSGKGLTRPELAVLLAYGKLDLTEDVVASGAPDDDYFVSVLEGYFPKELLTFDTQMKAHRLRREIISTVVTNDIVNLTGPTFPTRLRSSAGCDAAGLVTAFEAARLVLRFDETWARVEALDGQIPAAAQTALFRELAYILRGQTYWFARRLARQPSKVQPLVDAYRPGADGLAKLMPGVLSGFEQKEAVRRANGWTKVGAPKDIAHAVAVMRPLALAAALTDLASATDWPLESVARLYHHVGGTFDFDRLRAAAGSKVAGDPYERLAVRRLVEDMVAEQTALTRAIIDFASLARKARTAEGVRVVVNAWINDRGEAIKAARRSIRDIEASPGGWSFAKLTIANAALRELTAAA